MGSPDRWLDALERRVERLVAPPDAEPYDPGSDNLTIRIWPMCSRQQWTEMVAAAAVLNAVTAEQKGGLHIWVEIGDWSPVPVLRSPEPPPPLRLVPPDVPPSPPRAYRPGTGPEHVWLPGLPGSPDGSVL